jgi:hypothetical protein
VTAPKWCETCGLKPESYNARRWCYDCKPGCGGRPLPCRRCGEAGNYWAGRLCRRCHQFAPQLPDSCRDCLAWGATRTLKWLCAACVGWRHWNPQTGPCVSCRRVLSLNEHHACRLCWTQTIYQAQSGLPRDVIEANRNGQQLMLANMSSTQNGYRPHPRRDYRKPKFQTEYGVQYASTPDAGPDTAGLDPESEVRVGRDPDQLDLFAFRPIEDPAARFGFGEPPSLQLALLLDQCALDHAQRFGWSERQTTRARISLRVVQAKHHIAAPPIKASQVLELTSLGLSMRSVLDVLAEYDMLDDDRLPRLQTWFAAQIQGLPGPMTTELQTWFDILHHGSTTPPRSRPRHEGTIKTRTRWAMPTLRAWAAAGTQSLREITREDILVVLPAGGTPRVTLGNALRSIFTTLKRHRLLFVNPMARMRIGNLERRVPMPLETDRIRAAFNSTNPAAAAITALIGIHGLRPRETCALQLTDIRDGRIHLPDRTILLAPPTKARLDAYLDHRMRRWPNSINPHFLIHTRSATTLAPVQVPWLTDQLGMATHALRQDRILSEVHAGGDARLICDFFGVTITTAEHYTSTINHPELDGFTTEPPGSRTHGPR